MAGRISRLEFRGVEGESDSILIECFIPTVEYERARTSGSVILLGAKGTGKSAILRKIAVETGKDTGVIDLSPDETLWKASYTLAVGGDISRFTSAQIWRFHILLNLTRWISSNATEEKYRVEAAQILAKISSASGPIASEYGTGGAVDLARNTVSVLQSARQEIPSTTQDMESLVERVLQASKPPLVLLDRFDLFWDRSKGAQRSVEGLLIAWKDLNDRFPALRIMLSMRADSYRSLAFTEHDKIQARIIELGWDTLQLRELLARRVSYCLYPGEPEHEEVLSEIFPEYVSGVRGPGGVQETISYLLRFAPDRPRDLLNLCLTMKTLAAADADSFDNATVVAATTRFSSDKLIALEKEVSSDIPCIRDVFSRLKGSRDRIGYTTLETKLASIRLPKNSKFQDLVGRLVEDQILGIFRGGKELVYASDPGILGYAASRSAVFVVPRALRVPLGIVEHRESTREADIRECHLKLVQRRFDVAAMSQRDSGAAIFKPTTRTELIAGRPRIARDEATFEQFLDDMYQFIYESSGSKSSRIPASVSRGHPILLELGRIRDDTDHDLEHGSAPDIRKKMIEIGRIRRKYGGFSGPGNEQDWLRMQERIYLDLLQLVDAILQTLK